MNIEAYEVNYSTGGNTDIAKVLVEKGETLEEALAKKDSDFSVDSRWCRINHKRKISLSSIKINELSILEFKMLMRN